MTFRFKHRLIEIGMTMLMSAVGCRVADDAKLAALRAEIDEIIAAGSCSTDADCDAVPIGGDECGGPSFYLAFSPGTVDEDALAAKIREYNAFDRYMFFRYGFGCFNIVVPMPSVTCENAVCVAHDPQLLPGSAE
jgi:hypothetical protein